MKSVPHSFSLHHIKSHKFNRCFISPTTLWSCMSQMAISISTIPGREPTRQGQDAKLPLARVEKSEADCEYADKILKMDRQKLKTRAFGPVFYFYHLKFVIASVIVSFSFKSLAVLCIILGLPQRRRSIL